MVLYTLLTRAGPVVLSAALSSVVSARAAWPAEPPVRIVLLPAGERASVVVEFDDEMPHATAIEAADELSFAVEIGPVRSQVSNQLLHAATQTPLVSAVRVSCVRQGAQRTLITLHVTAKRPVSGLVRRAQRRIYIDLEPLSPEIASNQGDGPQFERPDAAGASAATQVAGSADQSR